MENAFDEVQGTLFPKSTTEVLNILQQHLWLSVRIALLFLSGEADILREAVYITCKILSFQSGFAEYSSLCNKIPWGMAQSYTHFGSARYLHNDTMTHGLTNLKFKQVNKIYSTHHLPIRKKQYDYSKLMSL
jgi:hypothetical protein